MEKKLKRKCMICIALMIVGIVAFVTAVTVKSLTELQSGYLSGLGTSMTVASIMLLVKNIMALRNPKNLREREIELTDERNIAIANKSMAITFRICIVLQAVASIILALINNKLGIHLGLLVGAQLIVYCFASIIISKKI